MTRETIHIGRYCIVRNVFGRKLSQIKIFHIEKFGKLLAGKDDTPPIFTEKTFANRYMYMYMYNISKFVKVFFLESFPLYGSLSEQIAR